MTRINLLEPKDMLDQHLMAEYREIPMIPAALQRSFESKTWLETATKLEGREAYTLGKGHVSFFYNKKYFLISRYAKIVSQLCQRQYKLDVTRLFDTDPFMRVPQMVWVPDDEDLAINIDRILMRVRERPSWYKLRGKPMPYHKYKEFIEDRYPAY